MLYVYRWHVALIHFPIALLIVAAVIELFSAVRPRSARPLLVVSFLLVCIAAVVAILATWLGWQLAAHTKHPGAEDVVEWHRRGGVVTSILAGLAVICGGVCLRRAAGRGIRWLYRLLLVLAAAAVIITAHWGGTLIYGDDYFFPSKSTSDETTDDDL